MYANQNAEVHLLFLHFSEKKSSVSFRFYLEEANKKKKNRFVVISISCFESINMVQNYYSQNNNHGKNVNFFDGQICWRYKDWMNIGSI